MLLQSMIILESILLVLNTVIFILAIITWNKIHIYGLNCSVFLLYLLEVFVIIIGKQQRAQSLNEQSEEEKPFLNEMDETNDMFDLGSIKSLNTTQ